MVALFHLRVQSHVSELGLVRNAYLFVDFFFVLSGFVIAAGYSERLAGGFGFWRFILLRFGRVYPLHLAVLIGFLLFGGASLATPNDCEAFFAHLFLLHGVGFISVPVWGNVPSWSISTEFFVYLIFGALICNLRRAALWLVAAVVLAMPVVIYVTSGGMRDSDGYQLVRGLYGFAAGMLAWRAFIALRARFRPTGPAELVAVLALCAFVSTAGGNAWSVLAPAIFAMVIVVFACETGLVSRVLRRPGFALLGSASYSIYMVHYFVARRAADLVALADRSGIPVRGYIGVERWAGDFALTLYLLVVIATSLLTYKTIEGPCRSWFRQMASLQPSRRVNI
jgi:peptidoglycan/LPS O-acetylase OafA/YrhL